MAPDGEDAIVLRGGGGSPTPGRAAREMTSIGRESLVAGSGRIRTRAVGINAYGGSDRLTLMDLPDPKPGPGVVLVKVRAAGVNPVDWKIRSGKIRLLLRLKFPFVP